MKYTIVGLTDRARFNQDRRRLPQDDCIFGNPFLDDALDGIGNEDLVIVTAKSGLGKTELATQIAFSNAKLGKRVHMFALEAYPGEIEARIEFRYLSNAFFTQINYKDLPRPDFQKWVKGKQRSILEKFEPEILEEMSRTLSTLKIIYKQEKFGIEEFENWINLIAAETDLIILDHLHFMDFDDDNENKSLKEITKKIRLIQLKINKPVIVVCQLRKTDRSTAGPIPYIEEIHGSSEIVKIATKIVAIAPAFDQPTQDPYVLPTYFGILKNRTSGGRCRYVGLTGFNLQTNQYNQRYFLGTLIKSGKEFQKISEHEFPEWSKKWT